MTRPLAAVLLGVTLVYLRALAAGYVWDDHLLVEANTALSAPSWEAIFGRDLWAGTGGYATAYYRPALTLTLLVDHLLAPGAAWFGHVHSLAWHLVATALVGVLVGRTANAATGAWAAAVFGLHPVQSEAVVWISARNDLLAGVGVLVALLGARSDRAVVVWAGTAFAALSKETGYTVPVLLMCWGAATGRRPSRGALGASLVGLLTAAALRSQATLGQPMPAFPFGPSDELGGVWALLRYLSWFVWPWPLTSTSTVYGAAPGPGLWAAALASAGLALAAVRREPARVTPLVLFSIVALAPSVGGTLLYQTLGERYLYVAMIGLAAALAPILAALPGRIGVLPLLLAGAVVVHRLGDWRDDATLFVAAAERQPDAYSLSLAGKVLIDEGRHAEALEHLDASLRRRPSYPFACRYITTAAREALSWEATVERLPAWLAAGCPGIPGFDDALVMAAARAGDWERAARWTAQVHGMDHSGRINVVRAALAAREGDLLRFARICSEQEEGAGSFRARVLPLLQQPLAPKPPPL